RVGRGTTLSIQTGSERWHVGEARAVEPPTKENGTVRHRESSMLRMPLLLLMALGVAVTFAATPALAQDRKPNILVLMGDDVGWLTIGAYHRGMMSGKTPNLDKLASEGMIFTDYYAEASCTAGRAAFITGEIPLRTGLTTVGQAGADVGLPMQAATIA